MWARYCLTLRCMRSKCNAEANGRNMAGDVKFKFCVFAESYTFGHTCQPRRKAFPDGKLLRLGLWKDVFFLRGHCKQTHDAM